MAKPKKSTRKFVKNNLKRTIEKRKQVQKVKKAVKKREERRSQAIQNDEHVAPPPPRPTTGEDDIVEEMTRHASARLRNLDFDAFLSNPADDNSSESEEDEDYAILDTLSDDNQQVPLKSSPNSMKDRDLKSEIQESMMLTMANIDRLRQSLR
ncbi:hypothetical protein BZG36_02952 [Bifiguratus adelaidae]|uniref:Uncharacterized protein n=1 Tax=Bifiguratus adelaidae TaxID=1938954 RepID=A0A261Y137_9FUNG|nr:hypothetical protein BZG36_02952 [Bifiguratus adelaidae]